MQRDLDKYGSCLCGAVSISITSEQKSLGACHCAKCRKWSGGPFMELECGSDVAFEGSENIRTFESSEWAERGFCKKCGSHLFMKFKENSEFGISAGLFEDNEGIHFDRQIFYDKKPTYYSFSNKTKKLTSAYIYEHFPQCREEDR
jgi:hypothetical protein